MAAQGIDEVLVRLERGDTLIVTELSRLGRNTAEIIVLVNELVQRGIRLIALNGSETLGFLERVGLKQFKSRKRTR